MNFNLYFRYNTLWKWVPLFILSKIYGAIVCSRHFLYFVGVIPKYKSSSFVISVGNITVGGTGKTPFVDYLLNYAAKNGIRACVLTRGYKSKNSKKNHILNQSSPKNWEKYGDEAWMLFQKHPQVFFYIGADRSLSAQLAEKEHDWLILDDGFQHLKLKRDLDVILVDAQKGLQNEQLIPLGPLREKTKSLRRADVLIYTKINLAEKTQELTEKISSLFSDKKNVFNSELIGTHFLDSHDRVFPLSTIKRKSCAIISGIANPQAFEKMIDGYGAIISIRKHFPDHYSYKENDFLDFLTDKEKTPEFWITTEKDWVKLRGLRIPQEKILRLETQLKIPLAFNKILNNWNNRK